MKKNTTLFLFLTFISISIFSRDFKMDALSYIQENKTQFNLSDQDINDLIVTDQYTDNIAGITHIWFAQTANGIPLQNSSIALHLNANGKIAYQTNNGILNFSQKVQTKNAKINNDAAIQNVATYENVGSKITSSTKRTKNAYTYNKIEGLTDEEILNDLVYIKERNGSFRLVYSIHLYNKKDGNYYEYYVDAQNGSILNKIDKTLHCSFAPKKENTIQYRSDDDTRDVPPPISNVENPISNAQYLQQNIPQTNSINNPTARTASPVPASYRVYPYYTEAPSFGSRVLLSNPEDLTASPHGWHDKNNATGADYTTTQGNNVYAYQDKNGDDIADANSAPNAGASLVFDYPLDFSQRCDTLNNAKAAVTQLFYMNNIMHDISYKYGFTEAAGNFQSNNYGRGGGNSTGLGDFVNAEAHDNFSGKNTGYTGRDNANFSTPPDGINAVARPRMQMFVWTDGNPIKIKINSPVISDSISKTGSASHNPCSFNVSGQVVIGRDSTKTIQDEINECCFAISNNVTGKIVLIKRKNCNFSEKISLAQSAGAIGCIIYNDLYEGQTDGTRKGGVIGFATSGFGLTIPSVGISREDGDKLIALINAGTVNLTLSRIATMYNCVELDGDLDNGIMAHEYTHGISNRLTGGPSNTSCLTNYEQGGEGWSDFYALVLTHKPTDTRNTKRGIGTYVSTEPTTGAGIRTYPYCTDMSVNPWTYDSVAHLPLAQTKIDDTTYVDIPNKAEPHILGEIWTTVLWDLYWDMIDIYGYSSDLYNGNAGNNRTLKLVQYGMTLQPCSPGFLDARNAIIKADSILNAKANYCTIWKAFARRGMGYSASQGSSDNCSDQIAAYDFPPTCDTTIHAKFGADKVIACLGDTITFRDSSQNNPATWAWTFGDGGTSTLKNPTHVYAIDGTYTIRLIITKNLQRDTLTKTLFIVVKPKPTVTLGASNNNPCAGDSVTLTAGGATSYVWSPSGSGLVTKVAPVSTTTYTVTGTTNGCSSLASTTLTVKLNPIVSVNSPSVCSGFPVSLTASGASTYTWTNGLSAIANPTTPNLTANTSYIVTGTATNGCIGKDTADVTVNALPVIVANPITICSGLTATLTASGANTYSWNSGLGSGASVTTPTLNANTTYIVTGTNTTTTCSNTKSVLVTVTTTAPILTITPKPLSICLGDSLKLSVSGANVYTWDQVGGNGNTFASKPTSAGNVTIAVQGNLTGCVPIGKDTITVVVKSIPTVVIDSINPSVCLGNSITLTASGATMYSWSPSSATSASINANTSVVGGIAYTVTGTTNGCSSTANSTVTVKALPNIVFTPSTPGICVGDSINITASYINTGTCVWNTGGTTATINVKPTMDSIYSVTVTNNGCPKTANVLVTVTTKPTQPSISFSRDTLYSSVVVAGASYKWYKGTLLIATTSVPFYKITSSGSYAVVLERNSCSSDTSSSYAAVYSSIKSNSNSIKTFELYPNPTDGKLTLNLSLTKIAAVKLAIFTPEGRVLIQKSYSNSKTVLDDFDMTTFANGIYLIKLNIDDEIYYHKIIKN